MTADRQLPPATWSCHCPSDGLRYHSGGVFQCFVCHATNPNGRRQTVPAAVALARIGQTATNLPPPAQNAPPAGSEPVTPAANAPKGRKTRKPRQPTATGPNKIEQEAFRLFPGKWTFEAETFPICGGDGYTPDGVDYGLRTCIEVKGEYIHSRDGRRRFLEAKHLHPGWTWIWARKRTTGRKGPRWEIEVYPATEKEPRA